MGLWYRLGNVIKSYLGDDDSTPRRSFSRSHDPDLDAAYEELDDFLQGKGPRDDKAEERERKKTRPVPRELRADFAELGLSHDATAEECKAVYKKLLKVHHPDRHTANPEKLKQATEKSARINAAYRRIENWFRTEN